ncbi:flippase [Natrinema salsiterrestre]|uniref:Flippase n=1 Tax=Natrinema salsiterrestre TaxID=2950540 RepID=A0A9Q4KYW3_9EURY|nr:flippase [Natrinema salsiterrestre]MDF9743989.1 flippase [Natrinema salsiterrestre]
MLPNSVFVLVSIALIGRVIGMGLRYLLQFVIATGLGASAVGLFAVGLVAVKIGAQFARAGLNMAAEKYVSIYESEGDDPKLTGTILSTFLFSVVFGTVTVIALNLGLEVFEGVVGDYRPTVRRISIGVPLFALMMIGIHATRGFKETKYSVYTRDFGQSGIALLLAVVSVVVFESLELVIYGYVLSLAFGTGLAVYYIYRLGGFEALRTPEFQSRTILAYSLPLLFAGVSTYAASWIDIVFLGVFVTPADVGVYQIAFQTSMLLTVLLQAANVIVPSLVAEAYSDGARTYLDGLYTAVTKWTAYLTLLVALFVIAFATDLLALFGPEFTRGATTLTVLVLGQSVIAITGPSGVVLKMTDFERLELYNSVGMVIANVSLNYVLIQSYGILGAAVATAVSLSALNLARLLETRYFVGVVPYSRAYWKGAVALLGPGMWFLLAAELSNGIVTMVGSGLVGALAFAVTIYTLGLEDDDRLLVEAIETDSSDIER